MWFCCAHQESISQSGVSSGSSVVGLVVTSSKRAYAIPKSTVPRAPVPAADHRQPILSLVATWSKLDNLGDFWVYSLILLQKPLAKKDKVEA